MKADEPEPSKLDEPSQQIPLRQPVLTPDEVQRITEISKDPFRLSSITDTPRDLDVYRHQREGRPNGDSSESYEPL